MSLSRNRKLAVARVGFYELTICLPLICKCAAPGASDLVPLRHC